MKNLFFIFLFGFLLAFGALAQKQQIDSLKKLLVRMEKQPNFEADSNYLNSLNKLANRHYTINPDTMRILAEKALLLSQKSGYFIGQVDALRNKGISYATKGEHDQALHTYFESFALAEKIGYKKGIARLYNNIAITFRNQGKYNQALDNFFKSLQISEKIDDKFSVAISFNNIGILYKNRGKYEQALENCFKSLRIREKMKDKQATSESLNNIAEIYCVQGNYDQALDLYLKSLKIKEEVEDKMGIALIWNNVADIYIIQKEYVKSIEYQLKALQLAQKIDHKPIVIQAKKGLSKSYLALKKIDIALHYAQKGLVVTNKMSLRAEIRDFNQILSQIYEAMGNHQLALFHHKQFKIYADSLNNLDLERKTANLQAEYEYDKKLAIVQSEQAKKDTEQEAQRHQLYWLIFSILLGFLSVLAILSLVFRSRKKIQKAYIKIQQAKEEIEAQAEELESSNYALHVALKTVNQKNKDIHDSINAAKRIQNALLPLHSELEDALGKDNFFLLFKPRDGVSGDFYWFAERKDTKILVVSDCTGHGVPGALVSIMGMQILNKIVHEERILAPHQVLQLLHIQLVKLLKQAHSQAKEGMDIAIIAFQKLETSGKFKLDYAGAMNPFYFVQNNEIKDIKADKKAIGGSKEEKIFQKQSFEVQSPCEIYLFTDGYQDQFGGEQNRKFMTKRFRELLFSVHEKNMTEQGSILFQTIEDWMKVGKESQTDDITVLGFRL
ncbi:MAG: hypothetical protein EAZ97_01310 [Bacteroidetes bacterium]|nr:MAG: hypothetical protein EAZ97_01310 [Bacteroidota bacterium]